MGLVRAAVSGSLRDAMRAEVRDVAHGRYLAVPTAFNARNGRRGAGSRVTPAQMMATGKNEAFVIRSKRNPRVVLWCLKVHEARSLRRRGRNRIRLCVGDTTEVLTGHRKGQQALARDTLARGFVPMFLLLRAMTLRKRLDIGGVRARTVAGDRPGADCCAPWWAVGRCGRLRPRAALSRDTADQWGRPRARDPGCAIRRRRAMRRPASTPPTSWPRPRRPCVTPRRG